MPKLASAENVSRPRGGQAILEYVLLFGVVAAAIIGMQVFGKRGIQATLKTAADDMSPFAGLPEKAQLEGMRQEAGDKRDALGRPMVGAMLASDASMTTVQESDINMGMTTGGGSFTAYNKDLSTTAGTSSSKMVAEVK